MNPWNLTYFFQGAIEGDRYAMASEMRKGCDVNALGPEGISALWLAAEHGHARICKFLLERGARIDIQGATPLDIAVQGGHADVVKRLWPHCKAEKEYRALASAISLGFHDIADFLMDTGGFKYQGIDFYRTILSQDHGFPNRDPEQILQWDRFFTARRGVTLPLHRGFFPYALLLAAKAERDRGLGLIKYLLVNCFVDGIDACRGIKVRGQDETALTAAAEEGNLKVLALLMDQPRIDISTMAKYGWPAVLLLLDRPGSISTPSGLSMARRLCFDVPSDWLFIPHWPMSRETVFMNLLQSGDNELVRHLINIIQGAAGILILPLLIRAADVTAVKWLLNRDAVTQGTPSPFHWVLLCRHLKNQPDTRSLAVFRAVATNMTLLRIWDRTILKCIECRNFSFMEQLFYPYAIAPPKEVTEQALRGLPAAKDQDSLISDWALNGFAFTTLWNALHWGIWNNANLDILLSCEARLNEPDPQSNSEGRRMPDMPSHAFFNATYDLPSRSRPGLTENSGSLDSVQPQHSQSQLGSSENNKKPRAMSAQDKIRPLAWAIAMDDAALVDALLDSPRIDVNSGDAHHRTPLMYGIALNDERTVGKLLAREDIEVNRRDNQGRSAIFYAEESGDIRMLKALVGTQKVDFSIRDRKGRDVQQQEILDLLAAQAQEDSSSDQPEIESGAGSDAPPSTGEAA